MKRIISVLKTLNNLLKFPYLYYSYLAILTFGAVLILISHFTATILIFEFIISFLPLATVLQTIALIIAFIWTIIFFRSPSRIRIVSGTLLLITTALWGFNITTILDSAYPQYLYSATWNKDLNPKDVGINLKTGFFNKSYFNHNITAINEQVRLLQLDILGIAELTQADYDSLKKQLPFTDSYYSVCPCQNRYGTELAIFSRFPLSNIQTNAIDKTPIIQADVTVSNKVLHVVVTHPSAPINNTDLQQRNISLASLAQRLGTHSDRQLLLMGDFNVASWSWTYKEFVNQLPWLRDANRGQGITPTWNTGIFQTTIDHMLVSASIGLQQFHVPTNKIGSDHHMIWAELQL